MHPLRTLRFAGTLAAASLRRPAFPYKVLFAVTGRCNGRCRTCGIWRRPPGDELTLAEIRRLFATGPGLSWVHLTGGEVSLREDFAEIAAAAVGSSPRLVLLNFPTNGLLPGRVAADAARIAALRPPRLVVTVSVDGDEALNDEIRGVPGAWRRQIETFRRLRVIPRVRVAFGMTLSRFNLRAFDRAFAAARVELPGLDLADFHLNVAHASPFYGEQEAGAAAVDRDALREEVERYRRRRGWRPDLATLLERAYLGRVGAFLGTGRTPLPCHALHASCHIGADGTVYPCSTWDRPLGNVRERCYDLGAIWNAPETLAVREEIRAGRCPHCWTPCEAYQSILGSLVRRCADVASPLGRRRAAN